MRTNRKSLLKQKREEIKQGLEKWLAEHGIIKPGESLHLVVGIMPRPSLPADGDTTTFRLKKSDWRRILEYKDPTLGWWEKDKPFWNTNQKIFLEALANLKNEPLHISEITTAGIKSLRGFTRQLNYQFQRMSGLSHKRKMWYTVASSPQLPNGYYSIYKVQLPK